MRALNGDMALVTHDCKLRSKGAVARADKDFKVALDRETHQVSLRRSRNSSALDYETGSLMAKCSSNSAITAAGILAIPR